MVVKRFGFIKNSPNLMKREDSLDIMAVLTRSLILNTSRNHVNATMAQMEGLMR
jgi:hypothetical protein